jgi:hypothetical protein
VRNAKKKRSGSALAALLLAVSLPAAKSYGLVVGTVFRETGHALPGAEVTLIANPENPQGKKPKPQRQTSTMRGEFTFRVPAKPMRYNLTVKAAGYQTQTKSVTIQADERSDSAFLLEREKKP